MAQRLDEGTYHGKLIEAGLDTNKNGTEFLALIFELDFVATGGEPPWDAMPAGTKRTIRLFLTDAAWDWSCQKLNTIGFGGDFNAPAFDEKLTTEGVNIVCEHQVGTFGNTYENWDLAEWGGNRKRTPPAASRTQEMNLRFQAAAAAQPAPPPPSAGALPPAADADDIPF